MASEYVATLYRYVIVFLFFLAAGSSGTLWITYAPVQDDAADYFNVDKTAIDALALSYPGMYIVGTLLSTVCFQKLGMRGTFLVATGGMFVSASLKVIGSVDYLQEATESGYTWALVGQLVGGLVQPLLLNSPAKLITRWYPKHQRDLFIAATSSFNIVGSMIGQFVSTSFVPNHGGFPLLHLVLSLWTGFVFILFVLFFENFPKYPPSLAAAKLREEMHKSIPFQDYYRACLSNFNFCLLMGGFGFGLALFNSVLTCVEEITEPYGYSSDDAGNFAAAFLILGILSALVIGPILDVTHLYKSFLRVMSTFGFVSLLFLCYAMQKGKNVLMLVGFGVFGLFVMPLLPISIELGVECTYPVPEEYSTGLLMASGNLISLPLVFLISHQNNSVDGGGSDSGIFATDVKRTLVITYGIGLGFMLAFDGTYKRLFAEHRDHLRRRQSYGLPIAPAE